MKKIILIASLVLAFAGITSAQTTPATKPATTKTAAGPAKKDGTPDMRYKANKDAAKAQQPQHLKKDGTADKRYKENKPAKKTS